MTYIDGTVETDYKMIINKESSENFLIEKTSWEDEEFIVKNEIIYKLPQSEIRNY